MSGSLLKPLTPLYRSAVAVKNIAYDRGWVSAKQLSWPVVSVGNLSVGGSGKTPLVIRLAQLLASQGLAVDVLSRGYGRTSADVARVDPSGSAKLFGDEPLLIAQKTGAPVYVGASRYQAGLMAESASAKSRVHLPGVQLPGVHLLDDGFQHRRLARDVDIVVVHASDFAAGLLPAGRLREPLSSLRRASIVVLRAEDAHFEQNLRQQGVEAPVWLQSRQLVVRSQGLAVAFCGIARPEEFFSALRRQGVELVSTRAFRDHHEYRDADIESILQLCERSGVNVCLTTEKDLVRLTSAQRARLASSVSMAAVELSVELADEAEAVQQLAAMIVRR